MTLLEDLTRQLGGDHTRRIGQRLGLDDEAASRAIAGALPMVLGGLGRNASRPGGADTLLAALDRDHDGSVLDDLAGYMERGPGRDGEGILGHVFGAKRGAVESSLGLMSGLDRGKSGQLLAMLAPIVMGALGRLRRRSDLGAADLASLLGQEQRAGGQGGELMGVVGRLLDRDGDGDVADDVASMGSGLLSSLLGKRG